MKIIAMIPARYAATRFPGKLMQDLGGKSVIVRTTSQQKQHSFSMKFMWLLIVK